MAGPGFPRLWQALREAATLIQTRWQAVAPRLLPPPASRQAYHQGLQAPPTVSQSATGMQATVTNTAPTADLLEQGQPTIHLPSHINLAASPKARRSKSGRYYLIIPFRHYSAQRGIRAQASSPAARRGAMPRAVYTKAQRLRPGEVLRMPGLPPYEPRNPQNLRPGYTHASPYDRMQRTGSGRGVRYLTFRTMTQDSPGWWIPARPPKPITAQTARESAPEVRRRLATALREDVTTLIQQAIVGGAWTETEGRDEGV